MGEVSGNLDKKDKLGAGRLGWGRLLSRGNSTSVGLKVENSDLYNGPKKEHLKHSVCDEVGEVGMGQTI